MEQEPESEGVPLSHYLWILKRNRWKILAFIIACVAATIIVSARLTPIYESTTVVDIDRQSPTGVLGQDSQRVQTNDADQFLATQVKLIQSDSVLRPVVQRYKLSPDELEDWAADTKSTRAEDAPIALKKLSVTRPANTYLLNISFRSANPQLAADVANAVAQSYIEHTYNLRFRASAGLSAFMEKQMEELRAKMEKSSAALAQFERELNVINPEEKTSILSARLLQLNTEFTNSQADRVKKEAAYNSVKSGSLEAAQASSQGEQLRKLAERLDEANEKFAQVKAQYGANHPEHRKAASQLVELRLQLEALKQNIAVRVDTEHKEAKNRESMLQKAVADTKIEFDRLNARSFEYRAFKQEAEADKKLYEELVRKIKEAGINASFQNSSIRLADSARPALKAVFPNIKLNALLAFMFSMLLAIGAAIASDVMDTTVRDPEQISRTLRTEVVGSLPMVKSWFNRIGAAPGSGTGALIKFGEPDSKSASFEEAIRTLRDSILLSDLDRRIRTLLVTSAAPREGKTTTSVHLSLAHASQKRRTLLIDGDLRRPSVHTRLGLSNDKGLSSVVNGGIHWKSAVQPVPDFPTLDVLAAGPASRRGADQVGSALEKILQECGDTYDLILVDAPPLLGFAEPLQMAALVDGVVVVTVAGQTNRNAVASVLSTLKRLRANVIGLVLNEVREEMSDRYYYYGYYGKNYHKYYRAEG
jgi:capsular exopolysaccharide synthesis family protein